MTDQRTSGWPAHYTVVALVCAAVFISYIDRTNISVGAIAMQAQLGWTETQKGLVLSAFFVGYLLTTVAGGALATRFGGKAVLGVSVVFWSLFTVLTPPAALISLPAVVVARIALGLGEGPVFPGSINMIGRWVPASGRSRAVSLLTSTLSLGTVFSLIVTGWLIQHFGWALPFYAFGMLGLLWAVLWVWLVRGGSGVSAEVPVTKEIPWGRILRLPCVWAILVGHFCGNWVLYVLLAWLPSYFKSTFGVTITNAGLLAAAPWLSSFLFSNIAGHIADRMLRAGHNTSFVRKMMQAIGLVGPAVAFLLLPHADTVAAGVTIMCFATATWAFCGAGFAPNCFDIAPRYAAVIWGLSNTVATLPGIGGVYVTGWLVDRTGNYAAPFYLTAGVCMSGALLYLLLGSGNRHID